MKKISDKHYARSILLLGLSTVISLLMAACDIEANAIAPFGATIQAVPSWICPGETVVVSWDAGEQYDSDACRSDISSFSPGGESDYARCTSVDLSSSPSGLFTPPVPVHQSIGSRSFSLADSTTFTLSAHVNDYYGWGPRDATVSATTMIIFEIRTNSFAIEPSCDGATLIRNGSLPLKYMVSGCVRVERICNTSDDWIVITGDDGRESDIAPGTCTTEITGPPPETLGIAPLFAAYEGNVCGSTATDPLPRPLEISITFGCDTSLSTCDLSSASMPVVGEPEKATQTPETACNLAETCGDGVCDPVCENSDLCSTDCPPPSTCGSPCPTGICSNGLTCLNGACWDDGICGGSQPSNNDSGAQPPDNGSNNQPPDNGNGGQSACEKSCGNQVCEPDCGETPNTCPADCP